jgi:hypothetical protein
MTPLLRLTRLLLLPLILLAMFVPTALAEGEQPSVTVTVTVAAQPKDDGTVLLTARTVKAGGRAASNQTVNFFVIADFFGKRPIPIGSGTTDTAGTTAIIYRPTWTGRHRFEADLAGSSASAPAIAEADLKSLLAPYQSGPRPLLAIRQTVGMTVAGAAVLVWLFLLGLLLRVTIAIARTGMSGAAKAETDASRTVAD